MADFDFIDALGELPEKREIKNELKEISSFSQASPQIKERFYLFAAVVAKEMGSEITTTQLRRFYTYVKSVDLANRSKQADREDITDKYKLHFILPKIAGSSEKEKLHGLYEILSVCLSSHNGGKIKTVLDLRLFVEFFEAILDYHASLQKENFNSNQGDRR